MSAPKMNEPRGISIGFGKFKIYLPTWVFDSVGIKILLLITLFVVAGLSVYNFIKVNSSPSSQGQFQREGKQNDPSVIYFSKSFLFWIPTFQSPTRKVPDPVVAEKQFHDKLNQMFGGWTRWNVRGSSGSQEENGFIYLVSLPKEKQTSLEEIKDTIRDYFVQTGFYVVQFTHNQ